MTKGLVKAEVWVAVERAISCGYCEETTTVESKYSCSKCGRVLCPACGERWSFCKDHIPICGHPGLIPTAWNQPRPEPAKMVGSCKHNMICLICGFGWGCAPDPCDESELMVDNLLNCEEEPEDAILVASGVLQQLVDRALQEPSSPDWERELEEL